jgi:hypothetical protein
MKIARPLGIGLLHEQEVTIVAGPNPELVLRLPAL